MTRKYKGILGQEFTPEWFVMMHQFGHDEGEIAEQTRVDEAIVRREIEEARRSGRLAQRDEQGRPFITGADGQRIPVEDANEELLVEFQDPADHAPLTLAGLPSAPPETTKYADIEVELLGQNGDAYYILGAVQDAMRQSGVEENDVDAYATEATSGDYNHLLWTTMAYVTIV